MATRGRKPQTREQKAAKGETRPSRQPALNVVQFPAVEKVPEPPEWLQDDGKKLWKEVASLLYAQKVLTVVDLPALTHLCELHGSIVDGYKRRVPPTAAELAQLRMYFSEFGMTPSSRTRVGKPGGGEKENTFKRNGKKNS